MSRQDKATTERNAKMLRELLKKPDNKVCADCKRNDPRWASWNLGVFLCIRCSGIHRSMGTHISKVKSVDLDLWTPEQMTSIQKWGNRLANLYWEAHLRPGHVPSDHKMDSFIRSKYESRRWALEGPLPSEPSSLDNRSTTDPAPVIPTSDPQKLRSQPPQAVTTVTASKTSVTSRQPQPHQLLSTSIANRTQQSPPQPSIAALEAPPQPTHPQAAPSAVNELFSLDFHARASTPSNSNTQSAPKKDVKQDILSLYSTASTPIQTPSAFGQFATVQSAWGAPEVQPSQVPVQPISMTGTTGVGMWGANSGWNATPAAPAQPNLWAAPAQPAPQSQQSLFTTSDVWGSSTSATNSGSNLFASSLPAAQKKDDAFGDIWGGFQ